MNNGGARAPTDPQVMLNTYIYDYFLRNQNWKLARLAKEELNLNLAGKPSPRGRDVNGVDDAMDTDNKDDIHRRPDDLPPPSIPNDATDSSFLLDWWQQFWDIFNAQRGRKSGPQQLQYLQHTRQQAQMRTENQNRMLMTNQGQFRMMQGMQPNGMRNMSEMQMKAMQNNKNMTPQQQQQLAAMRQQHMMQNQMQRDGSGMDMNQRPQSPGSVENAPSPTKRPRLDNGFNGQPMGAMLMTNGMDPNGITPQQFNSFPGQAPNAQKSLQVYSSTLAAQTKQALNNQQMGKEINAAGMQNSPMSQQGPDGSADFLQGNAPVNRMQGGAPSGSQQGGNHALQDYQMQLMLLEQQNKKRLLMARQEQDNLSQHPTPPVGQPAFPPAMSPQGSRAGPSPNPTDQMKRGTPKLNQAGLPGSPMPDGSMPQNRGSPMPNGFDPNQQGMPPGMPPQYYPQMANGGMMRPPSSHPGGFPGQMTPQQMEMIARQNGGRIPNNMWPQGGPPAMMPNQQGQQPVPMGTPQQRNQAMPPPPAPSGEQQRTQPSSPAPSQNAPPTPSQQNKANPKKKKAPEEKKQQNHQHPRKMDANASAPFGTMDGGDGFASNMDFCSLDTGDVLENFDFDTFLHTGEDTTGFGFDPTFGLNDSNVEGMTES
ncbi:hypothetical protein K490DRAFT_71293 [Saccharata proteae CBS 121410]|uniref:LisH domain-containing protein n=1 Tax=Saccharata proteae CBS 121410 TaxID=1314787 RepID=A0A9P4HXF7_9PEZI|nr:hypothetical protein K490DRAFT_71293 [Saccharata proteae CBS 121410]